MSAGDEYNGWPNRETWDTSLHLSNDEGLYEMVNELARAAHKLADETEELDPFGMVADGLWNKERAVVTELARSIESQFDEWTADMIDGVEQTRDMRMMLTDIGSLYRVDFDAVASNWLEGVDEGPR